MLASAIQGATRPSQMITWLQGDNRTPEDLTGATLTGKIYDPTTSETRAVAGTLSVVSGPAGTFTWAYHAGDVVKAGSFEVQFTAAYASSPSPARTISGVWHVHVAR